MAIQTPPQQAPCHGYVLASQHPESATGHINPALPDPYAIAPCPHAVSVPPKLGPSCKTSRHGKACWKAKYCKAHWCGACKKASGASRSGQMTGDVAGDAEEEAASKQEESK
ncbi:hypothetical protein IAT38_003377 [Cryptococcus sp. DSM 104549]